jgi:hypothetical protein
MNKNLASLVVLAVMITILPAALASEQLLSANDLESAQLTAAAEFDGFTILATAEKAVTIEAISEGRTAADGEYFNNRIKLNGGGGTAFRAIKFSIEDKAEIGIYLNSSSGTDARVLKVTDAAGALVAELPAPADDKVNAGYVSLKLEKAGQYLLFSASSGINIYQIVVK